MRPRVEYRCRQGADHGGKRCFLSDRVEVAPERYRVGGRGRAYTFEVACKRAAAIFTKRGVVVSVERAS